MSYRLFRVCTTGPYTSLFMKFLEDHHDLSFAETTQKCRENGFLYPGTLHHHLEALGVEVMDALLDAVPLQEKWLTENGFPTAEDFDPSDTFFKQVNAFKPDVIYIQSFFALDPKARRVIRENCPSVRLVVGHRGFPIDDAAGFEDVDAVFLGYPKFHDVWHKAGVRTINHLHCFDDSMLPQILARAEEMEQIPFSFIGSTGWGSVPHDGRYYDLRKIMDALPLYVYGHERKSERRAPNTTSAELRSRSRHLAIETLKFMPDFGLKLLYKTAQIINVPFACRFVDATTRRKELGREPPPDPRQSWWLNEKTIAELYPDRFFPPRFGTDYFSLLAASQITWNRHLEMDGAGANMRLFEACGAGACQIVDDIPEVRACYEPDKEIVTYRSVEECIEKARWLLEHPFEREAIARAGQERTLRDHTIKNRSAHIHECLLTLLNDRDSKLEPHSLA